MLKILWINEDFYIFIIEISDKNLLGEPKNINTVENEFVIKVSYKIDTISNGIEIETRHKLYVILVN